jgi:DNA polymerase I-like protein with 3'-5' exonuclease and polymerase domains
VVLGVNYRMGPEALAAQIGIAPVEARELLRLHRRTYRRFWRWSEAAVDGAMLSSGMRSVFGWRLRVGRDVNPRMLANFPMQANGAEMMRLAAIAATEAGLEVCCPVHDAFLIAAPLERLDEDARLMQALMGQAGRAVTGGFEVRTEAEVVRWPGRYMDPRGRAMWDRITAMLDGRRSAA